MYFWEHFIVMIIMTEGYFRKAKFKIKSPKINRGTLIMTVLNSHKYKVTNGREFTLLNR